MNVSGDQFGTGASSPLEPPVIDRFDAESWAMKKNAIVITTKVCRRTRSAIRPSGIAITVAISPASGSRAKTEAPFSCQSLAMMPTA